MAAGNQYNAQTINQDAVDAVVQVRDALLNAKKQYDWLNQLTAAGIEAAPAGPLPTWNGPAPTQIDATDAGNILAALTDLAGLYQFFSGEAVTLGFGASHVTGTYDHMTFGRLLTNGL